MCNSPVYIDVKGGIGYNTPVPCGYCQGCRIDQLSLWTQRANYEYCKNQSSSFVTFTYDDYHLPYNKLVQQPLFMPSLETKNFYKFLRNLRDNVRTMPLLPKSTNRKYSTFAAGEYGRDRFRPHYHVLFFGLDFHDFGGVFKKYWKNGRVEVDPVLPGGIRYCMKYLEEKDIPEVLERDYDFNGLERPFIHASLGFGAGFFYEHREEIAKTGKVKIGSRFVPIPAYYRRLYYDPVNNLEVKRQKDLQLDRLRIESKKVGYDDFDRYLYDLRRYREWSLLSNLLKSGDRVPLKRYTRFLKEDYKFRALIRS